MVGTILTYYVATIDLDFIFAGANTLVALLIAFTKMTFVVLYFMHVRWQSKLIWLTALAGFFWLAIMFAFTMQDYANTRRGNFYEIERDLQNKNAVRRANTLRYRVFVY